MADEQETVETTDDNENPNPTRKPAKPEATRDAPADDMEGRSAEEIAAELRRTRDSLKKANKEAADRRRRLEELESAEEERKNATLGEAERQKKEREREREEARQAKAEAAEAKTELTRLRIDREIERIAIASDFEYPDTVPQLVDRSRVEWDAEAGKVLGAKEAVERLAKERPKLLKARSGGGTPPRDVTRRTGGEPPTRNSNVNPYEQELLEMGGGGRM